MREQLCWLIGVHVNFSHVVVVVVKLTGRSQAGGRIEQFIRWVIRAI